MTPNLTSISFQFIGLVLLQVLILNNINFLGYLNPFVYIIFILVYPAENNRMVFIFLSFLLGLLVDISSDTGGIHAAACTTIAYIRPLVLKSVFGVMFEHQSLKFKSTTTASRTAYFAVLIFIHHFILFSLDIFNLSSILLILQKTAFTSIFSLLIISFSFILFGGTSK